MKNILKQKSGFTWTQTLCHQLIRCPPCFSRASFLIRHILARINEGTYCLSICSVCSRHTALRPWRKHRLDQSAQLPLAFIFPYWSSTSVLCHKRIHSLQSSAHNWDSFELCPNALKSHLSNNCWRSRRWVMRFFHLAHVKDCREDSVRATLMAWNPSARTRFTWTSLSFQFKISPTDDFRW